MFPRGHWSLPVWRWAPSWVPRRYPEDPLGMASGHDFHTTAKNRRTGSPNPQRGRTHALQRNAKHAIIRSRNAQSLRDPRFSQTGANQQSDGRSHARLK
ncbi:uncharacterized protein N7459_005025 [Penicillium hispanicum]|uniref:uncharacterized protein n=1 Tax=Penicillium hispanicum TaxID=1080232 RepID=UPI002541214D|nr:uncharacterized protein N7459_005025 [Penicillium hispanicum]KAJ5585225.1 hypothetical protein N7459_005025 [Penicillium hispanicum]